MNTKVIIEADLTTGRVTAYPTAQKESQEKAIAPFVTAIQVQIAEIEKILREFIRQQASQTASEEYSR